MGSRKQGVLAFEDDQCQLDSLTGEDVAQVLQDSGVKLAVLTACQSDAGALEDAFSSVAAQFIRGGVDTVTAMSGSFLVVSATLYSETFYCQLATGQPAPTAQEKARQALHDDPRRHVMRRRKDEQGQSVELRDWWLPHFYQQRPLLLQPTKPGRKRRKIQLAVPLSRLGGNIPTEPRYSFNGRAPELLQIERWLLRGKMVVIQGFGGVGKTALARENADWLTRTDIFDGACFVSFEHGGDVVTLLSALGSYLGIYDGNYDPHNSKVALARLGPVLKEKRVLVIADNLENILPGGDAPLEMTVRGQLWDVLVELPKLGAKVIVTSRDTNFGDGRLAPGSRVVHLELKGLLPEDAYELAGRMLDDLGIDRAHAPYTELRDLLVQLDHLPLAIQLVLPALREVALWKLRADFTELLPKFADDTEAGHNRSLLASLDYSLLRLPLGTLASIAELEDQEEEAQTYRRREREAFAASADNRAENEKLFGRFIADAAASAKGDVQAKARIEPAPSFFEGDQMLRPMAASIRGIWVGERDWYTLAQGMDRNNALTLLRVLESIGTQ